MNFEKYTERARGFVQSAQSLAMREGHPQLAPARVPPGPSAANPALSDRSPYLGVVAAQRNTQECTQQ